MKNFDSNKKLHIVFNVVFILASVAIAVSSLILTALGWNVDFTTGDKIGGIVCACLGMFLTIILSMLLGATLTEMEQEEKNNELDEKVKNGDMGGAHWIYKSYNGTTIHCHTAKECIKTALELGYLDRKLDALWYYSEMYGWEFLSLDDYCLERVGKLLNDDKLAELLADFTEKRSFYTFNLYYGEEED